MTTESDHLGKIAADTWGISAARVLRETDVSGTSIPPQRGLDLWWAMMVMLADGKER